MTTLRQAATLALEALKCGDTLFYPQTKIAIEALRAALAEPSDTTYLQDWDLLKATQESLREHMAEIHRLRAALAESEQEPVAWLSKKSVIVDGLWETEETISLYDDGGQPLYTAPPQRKPLTEEEIRAIRDTYYRQMGPIEFARAIEQAHGIKGEA